MQLSLSDGVIEVWMVDLLVHDEVVNATYRLLSQEEVHRADRFRHPADRRKFVICRGSLRRILARYLNAAPEEAVFEYGDHGKPRLSTAPIDIRFNVSRSGEKALIACTPGREIGVDLEWSGRELEVEELANRFFANGEIEKLRKFPPDQKQTAFLRCWTCKEAFVKAVGQGLSMGLKDFDVSPGLGIPGAKQSSSIEPFRVKGWSVIPFSTDDLNLYVSALAVEGEDVCLRVQHG